MARKLIPSNEFDFLTEKQTAVLELLADHRTSKEMAHALRISETAVNRRMEAVRQRLGGISRPELARRYSEWVAYRDQLTKPSGSLKTVETPCVENDIEILPLADTDGSGEEALQDEKGFSGAFEDPVAMSIEAPWTNWKEPRIVPRVLDGENATLARGAMIAVLVVAIIASLVLALAAAQALAEAVS